MHCCTHWLLLYSLLQIIIHFICTIPIEKLCINYCQWQLLYTHLQLTTFVCTVRKQQLLYSLLHLTTTIINFFKHCIISLQLLFILILLLQLTTFICIIAVVNFCMHHFKWQPMYALLYLTTFLCTIAIKFACIVAIEESNINTIRNIYYNNMNNLITTIQVVYHLFGTDILICRAAIAAKNQKRIT